MVSKEILENALNHYTGTCFFVSHDRYFINSVATRILDLSDKNLTNYIGNYDYYLEKSAQISNTDINKDTGAPEETVSASKEERRLQKEEQAKERRRKNELDRTEKRIAEIDALISGIDEELSLEEVYTDPARSMALSQQRSDLAAEQDMLYERWEELM